MSDPLQGYFEKAPAGPPAGDPLAGYFGTAVEELPSNLNTATGREQERINNIQANIERLQKIKPADENHKARIDKLIASYKAQLPRGYGFIEGVDAPDRSTFENVVRGASAGAINEGLMGAAGLVAALAAPAGKGPFAPLAERIGEARQTVKEEFDPQGTAGSLGEVAGGLAGGTVPYGGAAGVASKAVGRAIPAVGRVVAAAKAGGGAGTRIAANLSGGVPLNLALAIGQPVSGDAAHDLASRAKQFGIGTVADILFGFLPAHKGKTKTKAEATPSAEPKPQISPERTEDFIKIQAKRQAREAAAAYEKEAKVQARAEWQVANQGKKWFDLPKDDRAKTVALWKEKHPKPAVPTATPEQQAAVQAPPPPVEPAEVSAIVGQVKEELKKKGADVDPVEVMKTVQESDRRAAPRPEDAVVWSVEDRARYITDRQKAFAAKINKPWSQWTTSERAAYVADQMAIRKELEGKRANGSEAPSGVPAGATETTPTVESSSARSKFTPGDFIGEQNVPTMKAWWDSLTRSERIQSMRKAGIEGTIDEVSTSKNWDNLDSETKQVAELTYATNKGPFPDEFPTATGTGEIHDPQSGEEWKVGTKYGIPADRETPRSEGVPLPSAEKLMQAGSGEHTIPGDDFDAIVADVQSRGGLQTPEELAAFNQELIQIHERALSPEDHANEVKELIEDFTPIGEPESAGGAGGTVPEVRPKSPAVRTPEDVPSTAGPGSESPATAGQARTEPELKTPIKPAESVGVPGTMGYTSAETLQARTKPEEALPTQNATLPEERSSVNKTVNGNTTTYEIPNVGKLSVTKLGPTSNVKGRTLVNVLVNPGARGKGFGQELYLRALDDTDLVYDKARLSPEAERVYQKLIDKGLVDQYTKDGVTFIRKRRSSVNKTFLETMDSKPLEELKPRKIEMMTDRLLHQLDNATPGTPEYEAMHRDLEKLMAAERASEEPSPLVTQAQAPLPPEAVVRPVPVGQGVTGADFVTRTVEAPPPSLDPKIARKLFQAQLKKMAPEDLDAHIEDMQSRVSVLGKDEGQPYRERLDKALEERAERFQAGGLRVQIPPAAGGFTAGFIGGYLSSDDDTDKVTNALMWGAIGAGAGHLAGKAVRPRLDQPIVAPRSADELPGGPWQQEIHEHVVTGYERGKAPPSFREKMRHIYTGIVRRTYAAERFVQETRAGRLGAERNPAKQLAMYGRWTGQTESALKYGPALFDEFGSHKKLDSKGIDDILAMVDGDVETLGELMAARTKVEMGDAIKTPFDTVAAEKMYFSVSEKFHRAADEMRKFSLAMAEVLVDGGVLSRDALSKFRSETMYATLQRVFKMDAGSMTSAEKGAGAVVKASSPLKMRKGGSDVSIKNPVEATIASVPWFYRAAEQNKIKNGLVEVWEAAGSPSKIMRRITKSEVKTTPEHEAKIAALKAEIKGLTDENAHALVAGLDPSAIDPLEGTMRVFRNGVIESYKIPKELAIALQTMNPEDIGVLARTLGLPAKIASKGVTLNPFFLAKMAFFDAWQVTLNSQYGFRWGIDNMRGWLHIVRQSPKYREYLGVGGSHQSFAGSKEAFSTKLESVKTNVGSPAEVAWKQLKQMRPVEAYKTLATPLGDAARIGEYLRALDHGASTIEAVFAAKQVAANYSEIGAFAEMRALQQMTMFLGPAIQVMDQAVYRMGLHPFRVSEEGRISDMARYGTKAFFSITLPTMLLWAKYHDDEEITQLRQTQAGRRFWFIRSPVTVPGVASKGEIVRIPKPILDGQVWGTSMEAALDDWKGKDPQAARMIAKGLLRDAAFNILPTAGVIPYSLAVNSDLTWGGNIIPLADDQLALEHQGEDRASWISREVSKQVAPLAQGLDSPMVRNALTPAGLDYIVRSVGGMLGQDGLLAVSQAVEAQTKGYVPAKEELPLIKQVVVDYPNTRVRDIEMFYDRLKDVQTVGKTIDHLAKEDPEKLVSYMEHNQGDYMLVGAFTKARQTIANYRRAIGDIKKMDGTEISSEDRRQIIKTYIELMQQTAATAMMQAKEIDAALQPSERRVDRPMKTLRDTTESITGKPLAVFDSGGPLSNLYLKATGAEGTYNPILDFIVENPKSQGMFPSAFEPPQHVDVHEHAHHLWRSNATLRDQFMSVTEGRKVDPIEYAASNKQEQFAEAFAAAMGAIRVMNSKKIKEPQKDIEDADRRIPGTKFLMKYIVSQPVYKDTYAASVLK